MKAIKPIALVVIALIMAAQCVARAQLPALNPLVVPPLPPSPPAQLPAPASTAIAPQPVAVPSLPAAYSTPGARLFNCSCYGPGQPTHWMGTVTAASYLSASQSASGACIAYNQGKPPSYGTAGGIGAGNFFGPLPEAQQNVGARVRLPRRRAEFRSVQLAGNIRRRDARRRRGELVRRSFGWTEFLGRPAIASVLDVRMRLS
jgi:hypothetical protein